MFKVDVYSPFGIPGNYLFSEKYIVKVIIDPNADYFIQHLNNDRKNYDKLILIHGCEPRLTNNFSKPIIEHSKLFDKIYSYDSEILRMCDNSELFVFGSCWLITNYKNELVVLHKDYVNNFNIDNKNFKLSFIKSSNNSLPGHKLRHTVSSHLEKKYNYDILFPKNRINTKLELFTDSMFHLCIENSQQQNYFTEKIIDCFMSYTIPIYWGCPNIGNFFNMDGIITFNTEEELKDILENLTEKDYYNRLEVIKENYQISYDKYAFFFDRVNEMIKNL